MDQEGPIENYEEFFDDILDEHRRFVSITRLPQFWFLEDEITDEEYEWGRTRSNILIKNENDVRPINSLGLLLVELWLIFPELVEPAVVEALHGGDGDSIVGKIEFSLHTFLEVKANFAFSNAEAAGRFRKRWESGEVTSEIVEKLRERGYAGKLLVRHFNSDPDKARKTGDNPDK